MTKKKNNDFEFTCCICHKRIIGEYGNCASPVSVKGQCCNKCNREVVLPARLQIVFNRKG